MQTGATTRTSAHPPHTLGREFCAALDGQPVDIYISVPGKSDQHRRFLLNGVAFRTPQWLVAASRRHILTPLIYQNFMCEMVYNYYESSSIQNVNWLFVAWMMGFAVVLENVPNPNSNNMLPEQAARLSIMPSCPPSLRCPCCCPPSPLILLGAGG